MNNDNIPQYLKQAGSELSLSPIEREQMRSTLHAYMQMKPVRPAVLASSATSSWMRQWLFTPRSIAGALVVALFASSAGISLAAQSALPGDLLYPVKTQINEPVQGALAVSSSAKAAWAINVADTRIQEAATLAAENKLSTSTQQQLQANFEAHAQVAAQQIAAVASSSPEQGAEAALGFQAQLSEYQRVLSQVGATKDTSVSVLADAVAVQQQDVASIGASADAHVAMGDPSMKKDALSRLRDAAAQQLAVSLGLAQSDASALASSSTQSVALEIASASSTLSQGDQLADTNADPQALSAFQNALSASAQLSAFLQASASIHQYTGLVIGEPASATTSSATTTSEQHGFGLAARMHKNKKGEQEAAASASSTVSSVSTATTSASVQSSTDINAQATSTTNLSAQAQTDTSVSAPSASAASPQILPVSVPTLP